jgi:hypothetical protein
LLDDPTGEFAMGNHDIERFQLRAAQEREHASSAADVRVARAHSELAEKYEAVAAAYSKLSRRDG